MWRWIWNHRFWVAGIALSIGYSPVDGAFLASIMTRSAWALGYVLNFVLDAAQELLVEEFGQIQKEGGGTFQNWKRAPRKWKMSWLILPGIVVILVLNWWLGFQQLLRIGTPIIPWFREQDQWISSALNAGIVPFTHVMLAYAQAVSSSRFREHPDQEKKEPERVRRDGRPSVSWFRGKLDEVRSRSSGFGVEELKKLVESEWTEHCSDSTYYEWLKEI